MLILICFYLKVIEIKDAGHIEICRFGFALTPVIDWLEKVSASRKGALGMNGKMQTYCLTL